MRRYVLIIVAVALAAYTGCAIGEVPPPINIQNTTGNFWVNHAWQSGGAESLVIGEWGGSIDGFQWDGASWATDSDISISSTGYGRSSPTVFEENGDWYLISGSRYGTFTGWRKSAGGWTSDSSIISGLSYTDDYTAPTCFRDGGTLYLIVGLKNSAWVGYDWTGTAWQANTGIVSGLASDARDVATVFEMGGTLYLLAGHYDGTTSGYHWSGSAWVVNTAISSGLTDVGYDAHSTAFQKDGVWYLITGAQDGTYTGYNWNGSAWTADTGAVSGLSYIGNQARPYEFLVTPTHSYNVSVNNVWYNGSLNISFNDTYSPHGWQNTTVFAYNNDSGMSDTSLSQNTIIPNNVITLTNVSTRTVAPGLLLFVDVDASDDDSDTPTFSCNRTDMFTDFDAGTGTGNWTGGVGTYYVDFGGSDGYGSTDNYTMTIICTEQDEDFWWNTSWYNRETIAVTNHGGDDLSGFYVYIFINTTQCAWADCRDMRMINPSNYIEYTWFTASFNDGLPVSQESEMVYVQIPDLGVGETKWVQFYFNNSNDVPHSCSGMGNIFYYEDFNDETQESNMKGFEQIGDTAQTALLDYQDQKVIAIKNSANTYNNRWQTTYKLLVQPTATFAGYECWVRTAAPYDEIDVMCGHHTPSMYYTNLQHTTPLAWNFRTVSFSLGGSSVGHPYTGSMYIGGATSLYTMFDNIYLHQSYPYDPLTTYYLGETKPPAITILDGSGNLVKNSKLSIRNMDTGNIIQMWTDNPSGTMDLCGSDTFQVLVRTFDGVSVHNLDMASDPVNEIVIPINYNVDIYAVDQHDVPLFDVFAGLAEYTPLNPGAFWGMDLSDRGYVPVTNCSGFAMCDIVAEKEGYADYRAEALNWTSKSAMVKDYRHNVVMEEE